jgi:hypothetical protein
MHPTRKAKVSFNLREAFDALAIGNVDEARGFTDKALKFMNGDEEDSLPYERHVKACDAFLKETGFPTLAVASVYIKSWRKIEDDLREQDDG